MSKKQPFRIDSLLKLLALLPKNFFILKWATFRSIRKYWFMSPFWMSFGSICSRWTRPFSHSFGFLLWKGHLELTHYLLGHQHDDRSLHLLNQKRPSKRLLDEILRQFSCFNPLQNIMMNQISISHARWSTLSAWKFITKAALDGATFFR